MPAHPGQVTELFGVPKAVVGMIHVGALPGSPLGGRPLREIVAQAVEEARLLASMGLDALMVENMHDRPYLRQRVGPEVVSAMTAVAAAVREAVDLPLGVQILAGANREALAVAATVGASFLRAENFVFAHVADEGLMPDADAGPLLRYRREIGAEHVRVFADIKKKHAGHALTADIDVTEAARAAAFFGADGVIVTGVATGKPADLSDLRQVAAAVELPVAVGSGITPGNLADFWPHADVFIVGSFYKEDGQWHRPIDPDRLELLMRAVDQARIGSA
ncbi:MAG TPA: BtpA/SgcQ family protein [Phycisphaerae bacterium]|nr:BtpA/SgcQ family protein [Phycisphaerae bacterium]HOJ75962.1 BtpA/SgcQ family protein [Phycisphaerae bacterium]HOM53362.1 BtpA/SgcQ family protein [Phycisphaerae bacterium]HON68578.1 BtpA/SgcQ family protein [Phycisphaerae bacterium]HOQ84449.1 BtpA/SgcQ family protein [Phycisphaerae bacterium]